METSICSITDNRERRVVEVEIQGVEDGWYYGRVVSDSIPEDLRRDLEWYDEVVSNQLLSCLDDALGAVELHGLSVCFADETCQKVYSLHVDKEGETTFRITPVPPSNATRPDSSTISG